MARLIIDSATGEVTGEVRQGDRILRKASTESFEKKQKSDFYRRHFVRADEDEGRLILGELTVSERSVLFLLQYHVAYESGLICWPNGKEIAFSDLVDMSGMSRRTLSSVMASLIDKDIVYKGRNSRKTQYYLNPWIAAKGVSPNKTLKEMFGNYRIRSKDGVMWKDL